MTEFYLLLAAALVPMLGVFAWLEFGIHRREKKYRQQRKQAERLGLTAPVSLYPWIDPDRCIGSGACIAACPEKRVLGRIDGKAVLINGCECVGHGCCETGCPVGAITLVFGTKARGVDIPRVNQQMETSVAGMYLAGEVSGMGLIRNAVIQGVEAAEHIAASLEGSAPTEGVLDLVIVGAGPAGVGAGIAARDKGLSYLVCDQEGPGGAILHYPRGKLVLTRAFQFPGHPPVKGPSLSKEALLEVISKVAEGIEVRSDAWITGVTSKDGVFEVELREAPALRAKRVLIAVGQRGAPRKLEVAGEEQTKVVYSLLEPEQYAGQHVLVVGGGNSAAEAALALSEIEGVTVQLSYRAARFHRVAGETRARLEAAFEAGEVVPLLETVVTEIGAEKVTLKGKAGEVVVPNDAVIIQVGGTLPSVFLNALGVMVDTHNGLPSK